jgi:hypothetical protein
VDERLDTQKAAAWCLVAALALSLHVLLAAPLALRAQGPLPLGPPLYGILAVAGFGLILPPIATLFLRFRALNEHAAILSAMSGTALAIVGMSALVFDDLEPGALFFLGMWWWVVGKFGFESQLFSRWFGLATMALAIVAFIAIAGDLLGARVVWTAARLVLAAWLLALGATLYRSLDHPRDAR